MKAAELRRQRLTTQGIASARGASPAEVVSALCAMQAQDYAGGLWAIGLRLPGSSLADVQRAIAEHSVVRTWPLRGTLHFVAAEDVRWLMSLLAPRVISA
ncbi:MAG TPA: crosslink repair DNA glycosylase YcaQ family protein, partial [Polyangiales bacterium]|nr:crosslink repair DNA glycosylase YcaQ family protein [Polyangiales bacterium]